MKPSRWFFLSTVIAIWLQCMPVAAQDDADLPQPNPEALKAFTELVKSYRQRPALEITSSLQIDMGAQQSRRQGTEVTAKFIFGQNRKAVVRLRDFIVYLNPDQKPPEGEGGSVAAVHEKTDHSYYIGSDDGSPYYALLNAFKDLPFPELAIMIGEDSIEDVLLQLHPKALNGLTPTALAKIERDGKPFQQITLKGEHETMDMWIDADGLIDAIDLKLTGGAFAEEGTTVTYRHKYQYVTHDKPLPDFTFVFDPGQRQRVDLMASLAPKHPPRGEPAADAGDEPAAGNALVGKPAPEFVLATTDGNAVDLHDFDGRVLVLDFWASWCGPCLGALPKLHEVAKWAGQQELPVSVLTINVWEIRGAPDTPEARLESALKTWKKYNFTLPVAMDYSDETAAAYGVRGIPTTVVIRSDGVVHSVHVGGGQTYIDSLKRDIQDALKAVEQ